MNMSPGENRVYLMALEAIANAQIRAAGLTAENEQRKAIGASMAYGDRDFAALADEMQSIVTRCCQNIG